MTKADQTSKKLVIVIVNYFTADLIADLIKQINAQTFIEGFNISIVCVDNSVDNNQSLALTKIRDASDIQVKLLFNSCNEGFGNAVNIGLQEQLFDFACFINPDVNLQPNTLSTLVSHAEKNAHQGIWGGLTIDQHLQADFRHAWQEPSLKNTFAWATGLRHYLASPKWQENYQHLATNENQPYSVDCISGCCLMISNSAWRLTQGFDPDFFLYSEEVDLCLRARKLGYQPTVVPKAKLSHSEHSSEESISRIMIIFLAKIQYAKKHHGLLYTIFYQLLIVVGAFLRAVKALFRGHLNSTIIWLKLSAASLGVLRIKRSREKLKPGGG